MSPCACSLRCPGWFFCHCASSLFPQLTPSHYPGNFQVQIEGSWYEFTVFALQAQPYLLCGSLANVPSWDCKHHKDKPCVCFVQHLPLRLSCNPCWAHHLWTHGAVSQQVMMVKWRGKLLAETRWVGTKVSCVCALKWPCGWCWAVLASAQRMTRGPGERNTLKSWGIRFYLWSGQCKHLS